MTYGSRRKRGWADMRTISQPSRSMWCARSMASLRAAACRALILASSSSRRFITSTCTASSRCSQMTCSRRSRPVGEPGRSRRTMSWNKIPEKTGEP